MRIIAGAARGRSLQAPKGNLTRPTTDRVREAMFNALGSQFDLEGTRVLDLFAGSGALGIEALSRGAASAVFVEHDAAARRTITANLAATALAAAAEVRGGDAVAAAGALGPFDVVFCDPPYRFEGWAELLAAVDAEWLIIESDREVDLPSRWRLVRSKRYGSTVVLFARQERPVAAESAEQE